MSSHLRIPPQPRLVFTALTRDTREQWNKHRRGLLRSRPDRFAPGPSTTRSGLLFEPAEPGHVAIIWRVFSGLGEELAHSATLFSSVERAHRSAVSIAHYRDQFSPRCSQSDDQRLFAWILTLRGTPVVIAGRTYDNWRDRNAALTAFGSTLSRLADHRIPLELSDDPFAFLQPPAIVERAAAAPLREFTERRPLRELGRAENR